MTPGTRSAVLGRRGGVDPDVAEQLGFTVHDVVQDLRRDVAAATLPLPIEGAEEAEASRERLLAQLDEHLLPRLGELSSPAVVVLAGSTGAGKSTLFNSLLREEVSEAGVLRPTTREPVVGVHPRDVDTLTPGPVTELARLVKHEGVPRGTALMDAPDLDSFLSENRSTAHQLLEAADLWLFVTTAARYGDALPWQALDRARERGASVAMVLNRVPKENLTTIRADLNSRLKERGMKDVPLFVVPDVGPHEGLLEPKLVEPIQRWLHLMAGPERSRTIILRTLKGALGALPEWVMGLVSAVEQQGTAAFDLRNAVEAVVPDAQVAARTSVLSGAVGEGTVATRFAELAGTHHIDRVTVRDGIARTTKRAGRNRETALARLREEIQDAAARAFVAAGVRTQEQLQTVLAGPGALPAGELLLPSGSARSEERTARGQEAAAAWCRRGDELVGRLADVAEKSEEPDAEARVAGARKAFGDSGLATLLLGAALGNEECVHVIDRVLGEITVDQIEELQDELAQQAALAVAEEARSVQSALDVPALADDAAAPLRVRLAELRRLT
ncbi:GTPase domain-containing protein [Promicromonospora citrea]|uniref:GTPase domain-containing protein n=1 Tax=Promicromonospora citrea TaxID=43677 RepID=UPI00289912EC|nr:GTPase domain-containing protein [Promicromonospora citrea]